MLPWGLIGFALNLVTGMYFFIAAPGQYTGNYMFFWKIVFIMSTGATALYFLFFGSLWSLESGDSAPISSKVIAALTIFLWIMVLFCGHMLQFLGNAF
jgi:hypothetical protein